MSKTTDPVEPGRQADVGFHAGELAVQRRAGTREEAERLSPMLDPAELRGGIVAFLADRTFAVITARDADGRLWSSPLTGPAGFLEAVTPTTLSIHARLPEGDPLHGLPAGQQAGLVVVEFATRRRVRVNGTLTTAADGALAIDVEQAYGNCPQYIHQRVLAPGDPGQRDGDRLWWPDYPGNNLFNSFGNLAVDPEASLLFFDFDTGRTLQLSGTAEVHWDAPGRPGDDGQTGRRAVFSVQRLVAGHLLPSRADA